MFDEQVPIGVMIVRLLVAAACSAAVGWERESRSKPAGLRTHMLVAIGAAGFTLVAVAICAATIERDGNFRLDPIRLLEGIVGGIGFLGAGAIIRSRGEVEGLTTASSIWVTGAIGVASGLGLLIIAVLIATGCVLVLVPLGYAERHWLHTKSSQSDAD